MLSITSDYTLQREGRNALVFSVDESLNTELGIVGLLGESGTGKSTLLKIIAGLVPAAKYQLRYKDVFCNNTAAHLNPCVYVGSEAILFEHLSVDKNIRLARDKSSFEGNAQLTMQEVCDYCGINHLLAQMPQNLSSGEKQRVQFARALMSNKPIVLLDEAFSALDWSNRIHMLNMLKEISTCTTLVFVMVSHSLKELSLCCSTLLTFDNGKVTQQGSVSDMLSYVAKQDAHAVYFSTLQVRYVAQDPHDKIIQWQLIDDENKAHTMECEHTFVYTRNYKVLAQSLNSQALHTLCIDADQVSLAKQSSYETSMLNRLVGTIVDLDESPSSVQVMLKVHGQVLRANVSARSMRTMKLVKGDKVFAIFKAL